MVLASHFLSRVLFWSQDWIQLSVHHQHNIYMVEETNNQNNKPNTPNKSDKLYKLYKLDKLDKIQSSNLDLLFTLQGRDKTKVYTLNTENMCRILRKHPDFMGRFRYDAFKNKFEIKDDSGNWAYLEDYHAIMIQTQISICFSYFQRVTKSMVFDAIIKVSQECTIDSAKDYVKSLKWDEKPRLDTWLCDVYGVKDDEYHRKVGSNWIKGLIKRIVYPGCKFDYVLVLEGKQGSKKSTSLGVLGREWHVETTMGTESKDFFMQFQGKAIIEFSEGETLSRTEVKRMKAIITTQVDTFRPPYERSIKDFPRRCVFSMTTNQDEYLKDETGNRRWLPVKVMYPQADVIWLEENREQLFAEAYHRVVNLKETLHEFPEEQTEWEQSERKVQSPNAELVVAWYLSLDNQTKAEGITIHQVYKDVFGMGFSSSPMSKMQEMDISGILKEILKLTKKREMRDGVRSSRWYDDKGAGISMMVRNGELVESDDMGF